MTTKRGTRSKAAAAPVLVKLPEQVQDKQADVPETAAQVDITPVSVEPEPANPLAIKVVNSGRHAVFEPSTLTSIKAGATVEIICISVMQRNQALINLRQMASLNQNLEVIHA
jgi:hypothetical protein